MTKSVKTTRKYQRKSRTIRRRYRGSGASASRQSAKTKDPMYELNTIDNEKKKMIVYKKMLSIEKLAPGTIGVDFKKDPATMKGKELNDVLLYLGIETTQNEKEDEIVKLLKKEYLKTSNKKIDALLERIIKKTREQIIKELKIQKEKQLKELKIQEEKQRQINLQKQREHELQEEKRRVEEHERALRKEEKRRAEEQAKIDKFNAEIKEFENWDNYYKQRDAMPNINYRSPPYSQYPQYPYSQYPQNPYQPNPYMSAAMYHAQAQEELNQIPESLRYGFVGKNNAL